LRERLGVPIGLVAALGPLDRVEQADLHARLSPSR
jgi:hypothetical protein